MQFVDFGNVANVNDLRVLPDNLINIQPIALHCQLLKNRTATDLNRTISEKDFLDLVTGLGTIDCRFEIVDATTVPITVRMFKMTEAAEEGGAPIDEEIIIILSDDSGLTAAASPSELLINDIIKSVMPKKQPSNDNLAIASGIIEAAITQATI